MTNDAAIDLDAYFRRIGYAGPCAPTLATLRGIHEKHVVAIPFENLDVLAKRPIRLDAVSLQRKLVAARRGGYCCEQNRLLMRVLEAIGFRVTGLAARVRWQVPEGFVNARTHMVLRIDLPEGPYLADVGFGGLTLPTAIALAHDLEQETSHETYRLVEKGGSFDLQARLGEEWADVYRFTLEPQHPVDYEVTNWFVSTHPKSAFVQNLIVARPAAGCRYALFNRNFTARHRDGRVEHRELREAAELVEVLTRDFLLPEETFDPAMVAAIFR